MTQARPIFRMSWLLLLLAAGIVIGAIATRLALDSRISTVSFLANRVEWYEDPMHSQAVAAARVGRLVADALVHMENGENPDAALPLEAVLTLFSMSDQRGSPTSVRISGEDDLERICRGIEAARRSAFSPGGAAGTYNSAEVVLKFSDGTSVVFWLNEVGFSTSFGVVEDDFLFYSPTLRQALRDAAARNGELPKTAQETLEILLGDYGDERHDPRDGADD